MTFYEIAKATENCGFSWDSKWGCEQAPFDMHGLVVDTAPKQEPKPEAKEA